MLQVCKGSYKCARGTASVQGVLQACKGCCGRARGAANVQEGVTSVHRVACVCAQWVCMELWVCARCCGCAGAHAVAWPMPVVSIWGLHKHSRAVSPALGTSRDLGMGELRGAPKSLGLERARSCGASEQDPTWAG